MLLPNEDGVLVRATREMCKKDFKEQHIIFTLESGQTVCRQSYDPIDETEKHYIIGRRMAEIFNKRLGRFNSIYLPLHYDGEVAIGFTGTKEQIDKIKSAVTHAEEYGIDTQYSSGVNLESISVYYVGKLNGEFMEWADVSLSEPLEESEIKLNLIF